MQPWEALASAIARQRKPVTIAIARISRREEARDETSFGLGRWPFRAGDGVGRQRNADVLPATVAGNDEEE
ncbi:MAG TPA: hypothetical protein VMB85_16720 [Bryobacteraceae bacterium]|nr:hypothetical protein [Bryobacteraceae bacterium]